MLFFRVIFIFSVVFLVATTKAWAVVDIESLRNAVTSASGWSLGTDLNLRLAQGNSRYRNAGADLSSQLWQGPWLGLVRGNLTAGVEDGKRYVNKGLGHVRGQYLVDKWWGPEIYTQVEYDEFRLLASRWLVGGGFRGVLEPVSSPTVHVSGGAGVFREWEYYLAGSGEPDSILYRGNVYLHGDLTHDQISFALTGYIQPAVRDWQDLRILGTGTLRVDFNTWLSWVTKFHINWDREPPVGVAELDLDFKMGFGFSFGG